MQILAIDPGRYSVKFLKGSLKRKKFDLHHREIKLVPTSESEQSEDFAFERQIEIIKEYLYENDLQETKVCLILPSEFITTRFIGIPIKNAKKAAQTIPFQIEDSLPQGLGGVHFASLLTSHKNGSEAIVNIVQKSEFQTWINKLESSPIKIHFIAPSSVLVHHYFKKNKSNENIAILDIGHRTTKAYLLHQGKLVGSHFTYFGGNTLTQAISHLYNITYLKAQSFKHSSGFYLSQSQLSGADEDQKVFADLMDQSSNGMIDDLKKWLINYRVQFDQPIDEIRLTGGSSGFANFESYLTEKVGVPVKDFNSFLDSSSDRELDHLEKLEFDNTHLLALSYPDRSQLGNLLSAEFTPESEDDIPVHSMGFFAVRLAILCLLFLSGLMIERYFISKDVDKLDQKVANLLKNSSLNLSRTDRISFKNNPQAVLKKIERLIKGIESEKKALSDAAKIDALTPLVQFSNSVTREDISLISWNSDSKGEISGSFSTDSDATKLYGLKKDLEAKGLESFSSKLNLEAKQLNFNYLSRQDD